MAFGKLIFTKPIKEYVDSLVRLQYSEWKGCQNILLTTKNALRQHLEKKTKLKYSKLFAVGIHPNHKRRATITLKNSEKNLWRISLD